MSKTPSGPQRLAAVALSSSLLLQPLAPAFAESRGLRTTGVSVPTLTLPTGSAGVAAQSVLKIAGSVSPAIAPALAASGAAPILAPKALAASASAAAPVSGAKAAQPAVAGQTILARASSRLAVPAAASASPAAQFGSIKGSQDALYDNAKAGSAGAASPADAVDADNWTSRPAETPLSTLKPSWKQAEGAGAPALTQSGGSQKVSEPVSEKTVALTEKLAMPAAKDALKDVSGELESLAFGRRERYKADGAQQAVLAGDVFAWIDGDGTVVVHDRSDRETIRVRAPMGEAQRIAASQDGKFIYVVAGGSVQRWDLSAREATVVMEDGAIPGEILELAALKTKDSLGQGVSIRTTAGEVIWANGQLTRLDGAPGTIAAENGAAPSLRDAGNGLYLETVGGGTRLWGRELVGEGTKIRDLGTIPMALKSVSALAGRTTVFGLTDSGFAEWDLSSGRYRFFPVNGLRQAQGLSSIDASPDGQRVLVSAGGQLFFADLGKTPRGVEAAEAETRKWSDENPMFIKDGQLHIGAFTFPVNAKYEPAPAQNRWQRFWSWVFRRPAPKGRQVPPVSREQWAALNLPANKKALYQTLKGFTLGQNVLYIGETGGGKTWMSSTLSKLIGKKLYMVSFTEYTKNQDLLYSRTFGEEAKGKTGKTLETVLQWLNDKEGGILLLDEMHKPLEGIAALNNVLQNLSYHFNGKDIVGDKKTHFVIGTMNPVKPPYKGEPPSGELSSRFGTTVQVNYLPPAEEAALMSIFFPDSPAEINRRLVAIAKELRKIYPDILPLPISSRTLLYIAEHIAKFPGDDAVEIFKTTYNPGTIVEDPSIVEAIDKALRAHDLAGAGAKKG
jgi:MoxR-like ATPase